MRISMDMFLYLEGLSLLFEHHAKIHVKGRGIRSECIVIGILDISSRKLGIFRRHPFRHIVRIHILYPEEASFAVYLGLTVTVAVYHHQRRYAGSLCHLVIVCTERRRDMDYTCRPFIRGDIIPRNYPERTGVRSEPRDQLMI